MNILKFNKRTVKLSLSDKDKSNLSKLFLNIGQALLLGLIINLFIGVQSATIAQGILAFLVGIEFYLAGMILDKKEKDNGNTKRSIILSSNRDYH